MEVQCNSDVIGEVSLSIQEELTSTLQNALGVAVEIAVVEITKLLDRALRDVQEKIQEALQDNDTLKLRLQTAETQLSTVRQRLNQQPQRLEDFPTGGTKNLPVSCTVQRARSQFQSINVECSRPKHESEFTVDSAHNYEVCGSERTNVAFPPRASACDMTHGGPGVQTVNSNTQEESTQHRLDETNDIKKDQHSISENDQACAVTCVLGDETLSEVAVKMEKEESYDDPIPVSVSGGEEPNFNSLSLAQSSLLEDWRPQPLHSEDCQSNQPFQSTNLPLGQDLSLSSDSSQHSNFPKLHRNSESHRYPSNQNRHHCSLCGRNFTRKQHLKIHQRIHTGERPYACSVCSARFRHALTLTRHFRIHTGEKPYACRQCGKAFRNGSGLRFHQCSITTTV